MKRYFNNLIIVLLIILPFLPIADILIPANSILNDEIFRLILIMSSIKIIVCTLLIMSHRAYNSNIDGWILFTCGLCMMLPVYLEISKHQPKDYENIILNYIKQGYISIGLILLSYIFIKTLYPLKNLIPKLILTFSSILLIYAFSRNILPLFNQKTHSIGDQNQWESIVNSLLYLTPFFIEMVFLYRGKIKLWKFYTVALASFIGIIGCIVNIIYPGDSFHNIFRNIALTFVPCYWLGIIMLTKSARRLK